ncbi:Glucokinase [Caloramator mitchellensis]|uniref:Glucokinase n=1 Tax=Caloramator mitchellensis TaxID=908809 RepID=A0A0R3K0J4_CALMK|nr:ROK family protein [Caloramator mitchellensis]KRQ88061.1 Glucokinase [Caloramator mitchellensis]
MKKYVIGIDVGGTNIVTALSDFQGNVLFKTKVSTEAFRGYKNTIFRIKEQIEIVLNNKGAKIEEIAGIGIGVPGLIDVETGMCYFSGNLGDEWQNVNIRGDLSSFDVPVFLDNDVNVAALGEKYFGAAKNSKDFIYITIGTGIGSAIIADGKMIRGHRFCAGEFGHLTVDKNGPQCTCGNIGCIEAIASAPAIARRIKEKINSGRKSIMPELAGGVERVSAKILSDAYDKGDELAIEIMKETGEWLGIAIAGYINIINPELFIIGGGVSRAGDRLLKYIREEVNKRAMKIQKETCKIITAYQLDEAGMMGAIAAILEYLNIIN